MTAVNNSQFKSYLEAISESENYKCWWNLYTLTYAEGKKKQEQKFSSPSSPFDFGLMVQSVQSKQEQEKQEQENQEKEEIERLPVLKGIRKYAKNHVLLVGKPGSGKSTALARLLLESARAASSENGTTIPVLVELRYWQSSIFQRIQAFLQQHDANLNLDETSLKSLLRQGKFLLLIDGINELPSEESRQQVAIFRKDYRQTPMIFTTRDLGVGGDLGIEEKLEMQPLIKTQMRDFVMSYLPQQGEDLLQRLRDRLREFGKTPLLLWMLCELFKQTGNIPPNLGMVFRLFTQSYENNWRGDVAVTAESRRWWKSLLEYLAFKMMEGEPVTEFRVAIPKQEVEEIFTKYLTEEKFDKPRNYAKCWLEDLLKHHLIQVGSGDKIEFRHQLLQEYYAAEYLLKQLSNTSDDRLKRDYLNLLKWTEPVALMLALIEDEKQAFWVVELGLNVDLRLGVRLAGEVKSDFQQKAIDWILEKKLPKLLETEFLDITASDYAVDALINALYDEDSDVRSIAASALEKIGSKRASDALINALNHEYYDVRWITVQALGNIDSEKAVDAFIKALNHEDSDVRWRAAKALGNIDSEKAVDALINALNHEDYYVCRRAAQALVNIDSEKVVDALINALNHKDSDVRRTAAQTLVNIDSERAVDALINALNHEDYYVRLNAAEALENIGIERAVDALINDLNHEDSDVRRIAAKALGKIDSKSSFDVFNYTQYDAKYIRKKIQEERKFYNHEIFHSPPIEEDKNSDYSTSFKTQKILILAAIPHNSRLDKEIRSIEERIRRAVKRDMFEVAIKTAVRSQDIRRAIAEEKPLIVHFCGHGLKDGSLVLEDDGGNDKPVPPSGLAALFELHANYVKCVVLNACHSIKAAEAICKYINYVIGMNQPIQDTSAIEFAQGFYDGLGYENSDEQDIFQRAFQEGLVALKMDNLSQAEIPIIKTKLN